MPFTSGPKSRMKLIEWVTTIKVITLHDFFPFFRFMNPKFEIFVSLSPNIDFKISDPRFDILKVNDI